MNLILRDRTKITWHNLSAKVLKRLDILQTKCQVIFEPALKLQIKSEISLEHIEKCIKGVRENPCSKTLFCQP